MSEKLPSSYEQAIGAFNEHERRLRTTTRLRRLEDRITATWPTIHSPASDPNCFPRFHPLWPLWRYGRRQKK